MTGRIEILVPLKITQVVTILKKVKFLRKIYVEKLEIGKNSEIKTSFCPKIIKNLRNFVRIRRYGDDCDCDFFFFCKF